VSFVSKIVAHLVALVTPSAWNFIKEVRYLTYSFPLSLFLSLSLFFWFYSVCVDEIKRWSKRRNKRREEK
jgi:hypothetical protein